tara:strand:+ start:1414 stop:1572 length:159 start_codon:yes stop_codon:yes gene_type:complete
LAVLILLAFIWSSSEYTSNSQQAWQQNFSGGQQDYTGKSYTSQKEVRAIRSF